MFFTVTSRTFMKNVQTHLLPGRDVIIESFLPLSSASQTLKHQPGNFHRELTYAHSQQSDQNQEPFLSECKLLTTINCVGNNYWFLQTLSILMIDRFVFIPPYNQIYTQNQISYQSKLHNKLSSLRDKPVDLYKRLRQFNLLLELSTR